ncbi:MAG: GNAT family N-acetyltransferase [Anaerolineales bacterium]|nr:GNAT family N-acetyltransferase [Anaerolineales bacterium]
MTIQTPQPTDLPKIARVAEGTGVFNREELHVVREMLDTFFHPGPDDDYEFIISRNGTPDSVAGFACFGPTPFTDRVWDLYWICVDRAQQCAGIGSQLLRRVEDDLRTRGARIIYLETSDSAAYTPARNFYEHHGYERVAHLDDFYAPGEGKVMYRKVLQK